MNLPLRAVGVDAMKDLYHSMIVACSMICGPKIDTYDHTITICCSKHAHAVSNRNNMIELVVLLQITSLCAQLNFELVEMYSL